MSKVPTLHSGPVSIIHTDRDIAAYVVAFSLKNPGFTSSYIEDTLVSFRKIEAANPERSELVPAYQNALQSAIDKNLPNKGYVVHVSWEDIDGYNYRLLIDITDPDGNSPLIVGKITVNENDIKIVFDN